VNENLTAEKTGNLEQTMAFKLKRVSCTENDTSSVKPRVQIFTKLLQHIDNLRSEDIDPNKFEVEFWARIAHPFSIIGLALQR